LAENTFPCSDWRKTYSLTLIGGNIFLTLIGRTHITLTLIGKTCITLTLIGGIDIPHSDWRKIYFLTPTLGVTHIL
jgi:hypothetical protein